jgi:hypothetical protein
VERRWTWVAWFMVAIYVACQGVGVPLSVADGNFQRRPGFDLALLLAFTAFMVVGAVIVAYRPANAIGWLFSGIGLLTATGTLALDYAQYAYVTRPGRCPARCWRPGTSGGGCRCSPWSWCSPRCCFPPAGCCRPAGARSRWRPRSRPR